MTIKSKNSFSYNDLQEMTPEGYIIMLNSQKAVLKSYAGLSDEQTNTLVDLCYKKATTTIYPNSKITLQLLQRYYLQISSHKKAFDQIIGELKNELKDIKWTPLT